MEKVLAAVDLKKDFPSLTVFDSLGSLVNVITRNAFVLAGVITFLLLVFGGFGVIIGAGSGDAKKLEQGKQTVTSAVIGLILVIGSFWIVQIIETLTGISILTGK